MDKKISVILSIISIIVLISVQGTNGYVSKFSIGPVQDPFYWFDVFGFLGGGEIDIKSITVSTNPENSTLWFLACTKKTFNLRYRSGDFEYCYDNFGTGFCEIMIPFVDSIEDMKINITTSDKYYLLFANCNNSLYTAKLDYVTLNPGGEQLPSDSIPFPYLYLVLIVVWALMICAWCFNWIKNRSQRIKLHRAITLFPLSKLLFCASSLYYWKALSETGIETMASLVVYGLFYILFEVVFFCVLLTISCGWGIAHTTLRRDKYVIGGVCLGLILALIASLALQGYFSLLTLIVYVAIVVSIFRNTNRSLMMLENEMRENRVETDHQTRNTAADKYKMLGYFKLIMVGFLCANMLILFLAVILENYLWLYQLFLEALHIMMFISIGWTFRLRDVNIYYRIPDTEEDPAYYHEDENGIRRSSRPGTPTRINVVELPTISNTNESSASTDA